MMVECSSVIVINGRTSKARIHRSRGLFQGSILSPFLFNLLNDMKADGLTKPLSGLKLQKLLSGVNLNRVKSE
ncbi:MAG: hypothetical protein RL348_718 [Bacteroidota bacterium]